MQQGLCVRCYFIKEIIPVRPQTTKLDVGMRGMPLFALSLSLPLCPSAPLQIAG